MSAKIDFITLTRQYLEPDWAQGGRLRGWANVITRPLRTLNRRVEQERQAALLDLAQTGQQGPLAALLNDGYDPIQREIRCYTDTPGVLTVQVPYRLGLTGQVLDAFNGDIRKRLIGGRTHQLIFVS